MFTCKRINDRAVTQSEHVRTCSGILSVKEGVVRGSSIRANRPKIVNRVVCFVFFFRETVTTNNELNMYGHVSEYLINFIGELKCEISYSHSVSLAFSRSLVLSESLGDH